MEIRPVTLTLAVAFFLATMYGCADTPKGKRNLEIHKDGDSLKFESDTREPADKEKGGED